MSFQKAIEFVLKWEGGYIWDKNDPGGETKYGISKRFHQNLDIKNLTIDQAKEIYYHEYWQPANGDLLLWPLSLCVFNVAVLSGVKKAREILILTQDWRDYLFYYLDFLSRLDKINDPFIEGWLERVVDLWRTVKD